MPTSGPTQRLGAYAVCLRPGLGSGDILLTQVSERGFPARWWALPGGGVQHGESPADAMVRELHEETGLVARDWKLVDVHDLHTIGPARTPEFEDYHGIHLLYAVDVDADEEPRVVEIDGTTAEARWVPLDAVGEIGSLLPAVAHVLARLADYSLAPGGRANTST